MSRVVKIAIAVLWVAATAIVSAGCSGTTEHATAPIPGRPGAFGARATVVHVVDGDTVDLALAGGGEERARLLGIDTPETVKPNTPVECFGPQASAHTKSLLSPRTPVLIQRDQEARDRYGRLLVYIWRARDGLFVNADLVAQGFARTLSISPNTAHRSDLAAISATARTASTGLWGLCAGP